MQMVNSILLTIILWKTVGFTVGCYKFSCAHCCGVGNGSCCYFYVFSCFVVSVIVSVVVVGFALTVNSVLCLL